MLLLPPVRQWPLQMKHYGTDHEHSLSIVGQSGSSIHHKFSLCSEVGLQTGSSNVDFSSRNPSPCLGFPQRCWMRGTSHSCSTAPVRSSCCLGTGYSLLQDDTKLGESSWRLRTMGNYLSYFSGSLCVFALYQEVRSPYRLAGTKRFKRDPDVARHKNMGTYIQSRLQSPVRKSSAQGYHTL